MDTEGKKRLSREAKLQSKALKRIAGWRNIAIAVSSIGVAVIYAGRTMADSSLFLTILGTAAIIAGIGAALILNLGIKKGRNNVEKMLRVLEDGSKA